MKRTLAGLALATIVLAGCASPQPEYSASTAGALQQRVLAVTEAAATGDVAAALVRLQELEAAAYDAAMRSHVSPGRLAGILSSIGLVRADLEAALSAAELARLQQRLDELERKQHEALQVTVGGPSGTGAGAQEAGAREAEQAARKDPSMRAPALRRSEADAARAADEQRTAEKATRKEEKAAGKRAEDAKNGKTESGGTD